MAKDTEESIGEKIEKGPERVEKTGENPGVEIGAEPRAPREKVRFRGGALLAPLPAALVSCGDAGAANILTVAWTGILATQPPKAYIAVRPQRHSHALLCRTRTFVINLPPASLVKTVDACGVRTGAKVDKFKAYGLTPRFVGEVSAPLIEECPLSLCCRVTDILPMGSHDLFFADIAAVYADASLLDASGRLCLERADLFAFAHGAYYALGREIGRFGFSAARTGSKHRGKMGDGVGKPEKSADTPRHPGPEKSTNMPRHLAPAKPPRRGTKRGEGHGNRTEHGNGQNFGNSRGNRPGHGDSRGNKPYRTNDGGNRRARGKGRGGGHGPQEKIHETITHFPARAGKNG